MGVTNNLLRIELTPNYALNFIRNNLGLKQYRILKIEAVIQ